MPLRIEALSRRNAYDIGVVHITRAVEHDAHAVATDAVPPLERSRVKIFDKKPAHDIDPLGHDPAIVRSVHHLHFAIDVYVRRTRTLSAI